MKILTKRAISVQTSVANYLLVRTVEILGIASYTTISIGKLAFTVH